MAEPSAGIPSAFISYAWEDEAHKKWVYDLATRLRHDGVDVKLDQWELVPGDQIPEFMDRSVRDNDFVLIICTPKYKDRSDARTGGVGYEGDIMTAEVLARANHRKFIPVVRRGPVDLAVPTWLRGKLHVDLSGYPYSEFNYSQLLAALHRLQFTPPIGKKPTPTQGDPGTLRQTDPDEMVRNAHEVLGRPSFGRHEIEVSTFWPFFYSSFARHLTLGSGAYIVYGARGVGKSTLLSVMADMSAGQQKVFVSGREPSHAVPALYEILATQLVDVCFIDDVDRLLGGAHVNAGKELADIVETVTKLFVMMKKSGGLLVMTSSLPLHELPTVQDTLSNFLALAHEVLMNSWNATCSSQLESILGDLLTDSTFDVHPNESDAKRHSLAVLRQALEDVTGCHPALLGPLLRYLRGLSGNPEGRKSPRVNPSELRELLSYQLTRNALGPFRKRIQILKRTSPAEHEWLTRIAQGMGYGIPYRVAEILEREGLIYSPDSGLNWRVPGSVLSAEVLHQFVPGSAIVPDFVVVPSAAAPEERGVVIYRDQAERREVILTGRQWQIFSLLHDRKGEAVSLIEIKHSCEMTSVSAVRSAILRLNWRLREVGLEHAIENVWGTGYRLRIVSQ